MRDDPVLSVAIRPHTVVVRPQADVRLFLAAGYRTGVSPISLARVGSMASAQIS